MKKNEWRWWIGLAVLAVVYHVLIFALPFEKTPAFFISWLFTLAAFGAQVYVIRTAFFRGVGIKSKLYGFPIARIGLMYLAVQVVLGFLFMALGTILPFWLPLVLSVLLLGAAAIGLIVADAVREEVERQDGKIETDGKRMRKFQALAAMLARDGRVPEARELLQKLAEQFRFSDPVSSEAIREIEDILADDLAQLQDAVALLDTRKTLELCRKTEADLAKRNELCKRNK